MLDAQIEVAAALFKCLKRLETGGNDLWADPVGRNGGNLIFAHRHFPFSAGRLAASISCAT